jgi:predicted phosphodiesterase
MVKIQYLSDLHLEFLGTKFESKIVPTGDVLCLCGDICAIGNPEDDHLFTKLLEYVCPRFQYILHVAGNHEYYAVGMPKITKRQTMQEIERLFKAREKNFKNYYFLNCRTVRLPIGKRHVIFCGATLWTKIKKDQENDVQLAMNDYNHIYYVNPNGRITTFNVKEMQRLHRKHRDYIKRTVIKYATAKDPMVVLTHHKPVADTPVKLTDMLTQAYEINITDILGAPVRVAIHGHTHKHYKKKIRAITYLSNPVGYPGQRCGYIKNIVTTV